MRYNGPPLFSSHRGSGPDLDPPWFLGPTQVNIPKGITIGSAAFAGLTVVTDRPTDRQTDYFIPSVWQKGASH